MYLKCGALLILRAGVPALPLPGRQKTKLPIIGIGVGVPNCSQLPPLSWTDYYSCKARSQAVTQSSYTPPAAESLEMAKLTPNVRLHANT